MFMEEEYRTPTGGNETKPKVLFTEYFTLQIAPIHLLYLNSIPWVHSSTCPAKGKTTLISSSGSCLVHCPMEGEVKALYRCAQVLHTNANWPNKAAVSVNR